MATTNSIASSAAGAKVFLRQLSRIDIATTRSSLTVTVKRAGTTLFQNTYVPDSGSITIYDLDKLIEPLLPVGNSVRKFTFGIDGDYEVLVARCDTEVSEGADTFLSDFFLTAVMGERDTAVGRIERLTLYHDPVAGETALGPVYSMITANCEATYWNGTALVTAAKSLGQKTGLASIDASSANFVDESKGALVGYVITAGNRKAKYRVLPSMPDADPALMFVNSFGCWETAYLTGTKEQDPKHTRSAALINGRYSQYDIKEEMSWTAHTGLMRTGCEALYNDLARSKQVHLLNADGTAGDEIAITDCDLKATNDDDAIADMQFTYRRASRFTGRIVAVRPPNLFDDTFDDTFN